MTRIELGNKVIRHSAIYGRRLALSTRHALIKKYPSEAKLSHRSVFNSDDRSCPFISIDMFNQKRNAFSHGAGTKSRTPSSVRVNPLFHLYSTALTCSVKNVSNTATTVTNAKLLNDPTSPVQHELNSSKTQNFFQN